jgi:Type II restriction endonuclease EcoO109I
MPFSSVKTPYLFKAKGAVTANDLIEAVLDATVSSGEETIFGNFLENLPFSFVVKSMAGKNHPLLASIWSFSTTVATT